MKNVQAFGNWSFVDFVGDTVRSALSITDPNQPVIKPILFSEPSPFPTSGFGNSILGKKPLLDGIQPSIFNLIFVKSIAAGCLHIMTAAKTATNSVFFAVVAFHFVNLPKSGIETTMIYGNIKGSMCHPV